MYVAENRRGIRLDKSLKVPSGVRILGAYQPRYEEILTVEALEFVAQLERKFRQERHDLLKQRIERDTKLQRGELPTFLPETKHIREAEWTVGTIPVDLLDRRVEITGPSSDRKMVINAFNSEAKAFMADFEDANSPTWENSIQGQLNLGDALRRTIDFLSPEGRKYVLNDRIATLLVRPRGWHLVEKHVLVDGKPVTAGLFDFGLFFFHNTEILIANGSGPYFYLPKLESHLEARLWNDVFVFAEEYLGVPRGTIKATVLIETILAAFEMDEILYELREHIVALNCGRWDYIFSYIKKFRSHPQMILPDRSQVTMTVPFMRAYTLLTIKTAHKRNALAIGGMAAQIPVKHDQRANEDALARVRLDKEREAKDGHDGTWVAHPGLVPIAREVFDTFMPMPNQVGKKREDVHVVPEDLLAVCDGAITENGLRLNVSVGIRYIAAWLDGSGAVPIFNLMEDAATAEISRAQVWQWIHNPHGVLDDGREITIELVRQILRDELNNLRSEYGQQQYDVGKYEQAAQLFDTLTTGEEFTDFLTIPGYELI